MAGAEPFSPGSSEWDRPGWHGPVHRGEAQRCHLRRPSDSLLRGAAPLLGLRIHSAGFIPPTNQPSPACQDTAPPRLCSDGAGDRAHPAVPSSRPGQRQANEPTAGSEPGCDALQCTKELEHGLAAGRFPVPRDRPRSASERRVQPCRVQSWSMGLTRCLPHVAMGRAQTPTHAALPAQPPHDMACTHPGSAALGLSKALGQQLLGLLSP